MAEHGLPRVLGWFVQTAESTWLEVAEKPTFAEAKERGWIGLAIHPAGRRQEFGAKVIDAHAALVNARAARSAISNGKAELATWHAIRVGQLMERMLRAATPNDAP